MTDTTTNTTTDGMPQTPGVYTDCDGDLWVFTAAWDGTLFGMQITYTPNHWCEENIGITGQDKYQHFAPFSKAYRLDIAEMYEEKLEVKNAENTAPITEGPATMEDVNEGDYKLTLLKSCVGVCDSVCDSWDVEIGATPQGKVVISCDHCGRMLCGDATEFHNLVKAWNKESGRP